MNGITGPNGATGPNGITLGPHPENPPYFVYHAGQDATLMMRKLKNGDWIKSTRFNVYGRYVYPGKVHWIYNSVGYLDSRAVDLSSYIASCLPVSDEEIMILRLSGELEDLR